MTSDNRQQTIVMPKLGLTMTEGTLTEWRANEGDAVKHGDILFEFESEKSAMEFEAPADGVLLKHLAVIGDVIPCGEPVALFASGAVEPQTAAPAIEPLAGITATPAAKRRAREAGIDLASLNGRGPNGRIHLADVEAAAQVEPTQIPAGSPLAKKMAREMGVDLSKVSGSGPGGRVVKTDVLNAAAPPTTEPAPEPTPKTDSPVTVEALSGVRAIIAKRMADSAFTAPHVTLFTEADATSLVEARTQLNAELGGSVKISYNALLVKMAAKALREHPNVNTAIVGQEIHRYGDIHVALAVDTERGLLVPVIRHADRRTLTDIQQEGETLIQRAIEGKSLPDDLTGGTFTITNLGMFEIEGFTPIINQPQAAILGVGSIIAKPVVIDNAVVIRQRMTLSLSFDHRLVDGAPAAKFLQRIKHLVERPFALLA